MKKPIIGLTAGTLTHDDSMFFGCNSDYVHEEYMDSVKRAGGVPVILPMTGSRNMVQALLDSIDGLILTGGHDVNPLSYDEEPKENLTQTVDRRDKFDLLCCKRAVSAGLPVLGICRGLQVLNVAFGGTLHQDLPTTPGVFVQHTQLSHPTQPSHTVTVDNQSVLYPIFGNSLTVNSLHHQAINKLGNGLAITATAKDGVIEAVEGTGNDFLLGVQWHPEMLSAKSSDQLKVFSLLIEQAANS